jgi:hypothetical protein
VVFLAVLFAGLAFEAAWFLARGTNALTGRRYVLYCPLNVIDAGEPSDAR